MNKITGRRAAMLLMTMLFIVSLLPSVSLTGRAYEATVYANSMTGDDTSGNGTSGQPYKTFHKAYSAAGSYDTIDLTGTFTWTDAGEDGEVAVNGYVINKGITIRGHGAGQTIIRAAANSADSICRVFTINSFIQATFSNLEIMYGNAVGNNGGGIYISGGIVDIKNCLIHDNQATNGGGVSASGTIVNIDNSTFQENHAVQGGGIYGDGYRVTNSTFSGNTAVSGGGGTLVSGISTFTNCTFAGNSASGNGGGLFSGDGITNLYNCTFAYNQSSVSGGGIYLANGIVILQNTIVADNLCPGPGADDVTEGSGIVGDQGNNIVEEANCSMPMSITGNQANLNLSPALANNGGPTQTLALLNGSIAINAGANSLEKDQRGENRDLACDIGAYEYPNNLPGDINLSNSSIAEDADSNDIIGTLTTADIDTHDTFTYSLVSGDGSTDNGSFYISGNELKSVSLDYEAKSVMSIRLRTTDKAGGYYDEVFAISVTDVNEAPEITSASSASFTEGGYGTVYIAQGFDPEGSAIEWSISGGADASRFNINRVTGALTFVNTPSCSSPADANGDNVYELDVTGSDGVLTTNQSIAVTVTQRMVISPGAASANSADVKVNGQSYTAGETTTGTNSSGQTLTTVTVDSKKLQQIISSQGQGAVVTITVTGSDIANSVLTGDMVGVLQQNEAILVMTTETAAYTLPANEININAISAQFGENVALSDLTVTVSVSEPQSGMVTVVEDALNGAGLTLVVPAVEFTVSCTYGSQTVSISSFNAYVERMIALPEGVDPAKVTTAVVIDPDGTARHVPTRITVIDGKYYAVINSLTNSVYAVIYNGADFSDTANHWAKEIIRDMGARMVISGVGNNTFEPDRGITRAEFAAVIVRALGLAEGVPTVRYSDVDTGAWFSGYVETAVSFGLITGYDDGTFRPDDLITREQAMVIIARAMAITELKAGVTNAAEVLDGFPDRNAVSAYAEAGTAACINTGVVTGRNGLIAPADKITRAEAAAVIQRLLQKSGLI